jgi:hypothetical protein
MCFKVIRHSPFQMNFRPDALPHGIDAGDGNKVGKHLHGGVHGRLRMSWGGSLLMLDKIYHNRKGNAVSVLFFENGPTVFQGCDD